MLCKFSNSAGPAKEVNNFKAGRDPEQMFPQAFWNMLMSSPNYWQYYGKQNIYYQPPIFSYFLLKTATGEMHSEQKIEEKQWYNFKVGARTLDPMGFNLPDVRKGGSF